MTFPPTHLADFSDDLLVRCSRCQARAHLLQRMDESEPRHPGMVTRERKELLGWRLVCGACGLARDWGRKEVAWLNGGPDFPQFGVSLWLQTPCCGEVLWAYNLRHVEFLESYVGARLRERAPDATGHWRNNTMQSRLPRWMLDAHRREEVLAALGRLRQMTESS